MLIMKKVLFTLLLVCLVFFSFAKGKEMKLKNNVKIINTELLSVLQTTVIPNMPRESNDEGIWVYCKKVSNNKYNVSIRIFLVDERYKSDWKSIEGFNFVDKIMVVFENGCEQAKLICKERNPKPCYVIPYTEFVPTLTDYPEWNYELYNGNFTLIQEVLAW